MNTLNPTFLVINYQTTTSVKKTAEVAALPTQTIETMHALQAIQRDYEEAHISHGFWSGLSRFLKWAYVQKRAAQSQQRLDGVKQQLAQHPISQKVLGHTDFSHHDYARLLSQLALFSTQTQGDWL